MDFSDKNGNSCTLVQKPLAGRASGCDLNLDLFERLQGQAGGGGYPGQHSGFSGGPRSCDIQGQPGELVPCEKLTPLCFPALAKGK